MLIIDPVNASNSHASFNMTLISAISKYKNIDNISIFLEKKQLNKLQNEYSLRMNDAYEYKLSKSNNIFMCLYQKYKIYRRVYNIIKVKKVEKVVFLAADNLYSPIFLYLLKLRIKRKIDVFVILHNNIEHIQDYGLKHKLWSLAFKHNIVPIVLAEFVQNKAKELFFNTNVEVLKHPTYKHLNEQLNISKDIETLNFVTLGRHSNAFKNPVLANGFFQTCETYPKDIAIHLYIKENIIENDYVKGTFVNNYSFPMSNSEYWRILYSSHFLIIPPGSADRLTASGVLADGLTAGLLIIAPKKGAFIEFIPKSCYIFLYDGNDISNAVFKALSLSTSEYKKYQKDIINYSELFSKENTGVRLNEIMDTV